MPPSPNSNANPKPKPDPIRETIFLGGNFPDTVNKVGNYFFLNLMSSNGMSTKENTLQLLPQVHSTSASESESETKINLIKIGKYIMYNNNI